MEFIVLTYFPWNDKNSELAVRLSELLNDGWTIQHATSTKEAIVYVLGRNKLSAAPSGGYQGSTGIVADRHYDSPGQA